MEKGSRRGGGINRGVVKARLPREDGCGDDGGMKRRAFVMGAAALAAERMELFLLMGQSNMAGRGVVEEQDRTVIPGVFALNKERAWVPAVDPIHFDKPIAGVGLGRSFARTLLRLRPGGRIGLVPAAFGGTSLEEWKPGGKLFADAVERARSGMKDGRLRGILWHQGEAECGEEGRARSYAERWLPLMKALRGELGLGEVPVVAGELGRFLRAEKQPFAGIVNEELAVLAVRGRRVAFVSSEGLAHKGDELHFDSAGLREFGRRYAMAYAELDGEWMQ